MRPSRALPVRTSPTTERTERPRARSSASVRSVGAAERPIITVTSRSASRAGSSSIAASTGSSLVGIAPVAAQRKIETLPLRRTVRRRMTGSEPCGATCNGIESTLERRPREGKRRVQPRVRSQPGASSPRRGPASPAVGSGARTLLDPCRSAGRLVGSVPASDFRRGAAASAPQNLSVSAGTKLNRRSTVSPTA